MLYINIIMQFIIDRTPTEITQGHFVLGQAIQILQVISMLSVTLSVSIRSITALVLLMINLNKILISPLVSWFSEIGGMKKKDDSFYKYPLIN